MMRTTVNLPDDIYEIARSLAYSKRISLGEALAELARKGLSGTSRVAPEAAAFPCFSVSPEALPVTLEQTLEAEGAW